MIKCSKCKEVKPVTEFYTNSYWCKACQKVYQKTDKRKAYKKAYFKTAKGKAYMAARRKTQEYKDYHKSYQKKYRQTQEYKDYQKSYQKKYRQTQEYKTNMKAYYQTDKGKANAARGAHKRRALIKSIPCDLTAEQWEEIKASQDYRCAMCGKVKKLHRDHIFPLSKGGAFTKDNIQGLCKSCNSKKSNKIINMAELIMV